MRTSYASLSERRNSEEICFANYLAKVMRRSAAAGGGGGARFARTSNIQRRTSNIQCFKLLPFHSRGMHAALPLQCGTLPFDVGRWMFDVGRSWRQGALQFVRHTP
ncbi:hypothetical protein Ga0100231_010515 [Opitutaceae bacterium TAV4]|nr:hypothetical protein Ga0100231_010515 [Opitutaceae bacterium TAV4]